MAKKVDDGKIYIGPSKMGSMKECARCFWILANKHIKDYPEGISAGLPKGIDRTLKAHYDRYRPELPPEIRGTVPGTLFKDADVLKKWRYWDGGLRYEVPGYNLVIRGALDDMTVHNGCYRPLDYKTKASQEKAEILEDAVKYNGTQLDFYGLFMEVQGKKVDGIGYIANYYPVEVERGVHEHELRRDVPVNYLFGCAVHELQIDTQRAKDLALEAAKLISGPMPAEGAGCDYCAFARNHAELMAKFSKTAVLS